MTLAQMDLRCGGCSTPLDPVQRYCVVCGAHARHAADPAARYLQATRTRRGAPAAPAATAPTAGAAVRGHSLATAIAVAIIPLAVALGLVIGRSGSGADERLLAALRAQSARAAAVSAAASTAQPAAAATTGAAARRRATKPKAGGGAVLARTANGTVHELSGAGTTPVEKAAGAQIVQRISHQTGGSYTASQQNLPDQIAVP